jgi:putative transcriptional regulator
MRILCIVVLVALAQLCVPAAPAQSTRVDDLGAGKILVASRDLPDPNFSKTVVLLTQFEDDGVVGLILNRRSTVPISRVLESLNGAKDRSDPVYAGGPVSKAAVLALLRSHNKPDDAQRVFGDIYLISTKEQLEKTFASAADSNSLHIYLGYAGWTGPQLENEVDLGAWFIFRGDAAAVFDSDPDSVWPRLIHQTEQQIAARQLPRLFHPLMR